MSGALPTWSCPPAAPDVTSEYWRPTRSRRQAEEISTIVDESAEPLGPGDGPGPDADARGERTPASGEVLIGTVYRWDSVWSTLANHADDRYSRRWAHQGEPEILKFEHGPATYLFDNSAGPRAERTVLAVAHPRAPDSTRDASYQAGYPLPEQLAHRPVDRGHYIPHSGGGLFGPNMFVQDRALNRGWSRQGRLYRSLERRAVTSPGAILFARPDYADASDIPVTIDLGVIDHLGAKAYRFRNHYGLPMGREPGHANHIDHLDVRPEGPAERVGDEDELAVALNGAVSGQIGALGEETAAIFLAEELGATIVAMGDVGMPRNGSSQDLDIVAELDGELVAFEVKTKFLSDSAGRRTRAGDLPRPRMRRSARGRDRQGSQAYVTDRLASLIDTNTDYAGIKVRVLAVDLRLMQLQQFTINETGSRLTPLDAPASCLAAARTALTAIIGHRGYL